MGDKPSGGFVPGMKVQEFTLIKWLQTDEQGEKWLVKSPAHPLGVSVYLKRSIEVKQGFRALPDRGLKQGMIFGAWQLKHFVTRATTAELWEVKKNQDSQKCIIKIGTSDQPERVKQVIHEIGLLNRLENFSGTVSLLDYNIQPEGTYPWFVMPWTDNVKEFLGPASNEIKINAAVQSFITLVKQLAQQNVYYPDIQLEHMRYEQDKAVLIDWGNAIYPADKFIVNGHLLKPNSQVVAEQVLNILAELYQHFQLKMPASLTQNHSVDLDELSEQLITNNEGMERKT